MAVFMAILTTPSNADLTSLIAAYPLGSLRSAKGIEAGTVNTSYALELDRGRFFLRIYEEQDQAGAAREAKVLRHLAEKGVPTPAPVISNDGTTCRTIAGKPCALFPWIDGEILCQARVKKEIALQAGASVARIHLAGHAPDAVLDEGRFSPEELALRCDRISSSPDESARLLTEPLREAVRDFAKRRRERNPAPSGLIHGDLFRDNVLWDVSTHPCRITALLDFESAHDGPFAYDLAVTILSWSYGSTLDLDVARAIVDGYRSVRELEPGDRDVLYEESIFAALRFTITRITDDAIRVGKKWQRFVERRVALEGLGKKRFAEALGL
jgi:homoserine kinase type II